VTAVSTAKFLRIPRGPVEVVYIRPRRLNVCSPIHLFMNGLQTMGDEQAAAHNVCPWATSCPRIGTVFMGKR